MREEPVKIIFAKTGTKKNELHQIATNNPEYTRIYMSVQKTGCRTKLCLSKKEVGELYIVSNAEYPQCSDYVSNGLKSEYCALDSQVVKTKDCMPNNPTTTDSKPSEDRSIKKAKQTTLLDMFMKH